MKKEDLTGYMELISAVTNTKLKVRAQKLLEAMEQSQIHTFGWPIGIVMPREPWAPKPTADGIKATIKTDDSYDYWTLNENGDFYLLKQLFEERRRPGHLFLDTRIVRTAEAFCRLGKLYERLEVERSAEIVVELTYGGLKNRVLSVASPRRWLATDRKCSVPLFSRTYSVTLSQLLEHDPIVDMVFDYVSGLFEKFDFFVVEKTLVSDIVTKFLAGRID